MNRKKPYIYKRIVAYTIDFLIITLLSGLLTLVLTDSTKYEADSQRLVELTNKYTSNEITQEEFKVQFDDINYDLTLHSKGVTIITVSTTLVYCVVMCYFCHGITLGKYIMKIRIVSANGKDLNIFNYLLRSLIVNNILLNSVTIILISALEKESYLNIYPTVSNVFTFLIIITFIFMMYRNDGRGIHDLISNTKVDNIKKGEDSVIDAKIVSEEENKEEGSDNDERTIRTRNSKKRKTK